MELKIVNNESANIAQKFGISAFRRDELLDFVEQQYYEVVNSPAGVTPLVKKYENIAKFCKSVEEYTLCMHCFLLNISKIGKTIDDGYFAN